jgi:hypothetical protein
MSLINLSVKHGLNRDEARSHLEKAVNEVQNKFGVLIRKVDWTADRSRVRLDGTGFWAEMWVDTQDVHATGDIPALAGFLGGPLASGLTQIIRRNFPKSLT